MMTFAVYSIIFLLSLISFQACTGLGGKDLDYIEAKVEKKEAAKDSLHRLKLVFVGDIMGHGDQIRSAFDPESGMFDYEPCFRYIRPIIESSDFAFANLELTLNDKNYYSGYPLFRSPDALAGYLKQAGFDIIITTNNHSNDNNKYGLMHTLDVLDSLKLMHTGTFRDTAEWEQSYPMILEKETDGAKFRLALIAYTYATNGIPTQKPNVVNEIDTAQIRKDIEKAKKSNPDMIIAYMHWGAEYQRIEAKTQSDLAKWLWSQGVDIVIGSHPHVIQPIRSDTVYNADSTEGRRVVCAYSLGNFISNQFHPVHTEIGLIFEIEIIKNDKTGKTVIGNHNYIPAWRYIHNEKKKKVSEWVHTIIPVSAFESDTLNFLTMPKAKIKEMLSLTEMTRKHLNKFGATERLINFKDIVRIGMLPPGEVVTPLPSSEKPFVVKVN